MHMANSLICPAIGGAMWAVTGATVAVSARAMTRTMDRSQVPLMGVMGAFVFATQMINFTIPGTGSSGHFAGGLLLAIVLGRYAGFLTMATVLAVQALFFADGGLLAYGANAFNMGFIPCFVVYPLLSRLMAGGMSAKPWLSRAALWVSAVVALQLGASGVVVETAASGITELPFSTFVLAMLPIHLAIGVVEGLVTLAVAEFVTRAEPRLAMFAAPTPSGTVSAFRAAPAPVTLAVLGVLALAAGGMLSWFASAYPDGLEWSVASITGQPEIAEPASPVHAAAAHIQEKTAVLPDYGFPASAAPGSDNAGEATSAGTDSEAAWGAPNAGTSVAGITGVMLTLAFAALLGWTFRRRMPLHTATA